MSNVLIVKDPELSDGVVLTGLSHNSSFGPNFPVSTNFHLAKENRPEVWGNYSTGILTWGDELALQYNFLKHPYFDPEVLAKAEAIKAPFAVSEFLTLWLSSLVALDFTGPVLVSARVLENLMKPSISRDSSTDCSSSLRPATQTCPFVPETALASWSQRRPTFQLPPTSRHMYSRTLRTD